MSAAHIADVHNDFSFRNPEEDLIKRGVMPFSALKGDFLRVHTRERQIDPNLGLTLVAQFVTTIKFQRTPVEAPYERSGITLTACFCTSFTCVKAGHFPTALWVEAHPELFHRGQRCLVPRVAALIRQKLACNDSIMEVWMFVFRSCGNWRNWIGLWCRCLLRRWLGWHRLRPIQAVLQLPC